jgi:hypothetical protein
MRPLFASGSLSMTDLEAGFARLAPWLMVAAPLIALVLFETTRGFAFVRRWFS